MEVFKHQETKEDFHDIPLEEALRQVASSRQVHANWYREAYPDVGLSGVSPAEHYLRYGADLGRNPGRRFDTDFYKRTYLGEAAQDVNPLLHYLRHGQEKGHHVRPEFLDARNRAKKRLNALRLELHALGLTEAALGGLQELLDQSDFPEVQLRATRELALWHLTEVGRDNWRKSIDYVERARSLCQSVGERRKLRVIELLSWYFLDERGEAAIAMEDAGLAGEISPDVILAWANHEDDPGLRCAWVNRALASFGLSPVSLLQESPDQPLYDRLTSGTGLPVVADGPRVSVLLAAYNSAKTLPTALRSLQEQTWRNLEILLVDDCSADSGATYRIAEQFSQEDPRIRLIRSEKNMGAYVARNRGLAEATGEFVTLHDADDWSHAQKIETQVSHLLGNDGVIGCTTRQARATEDLRFVGVRASADLISLNTSSLLFRREPVVKKLGFWDAVRFGADSEFIARMKIVFGGAACCEISSGPLSFQRRESGSATMDPTTGLGLAYFGARREYFNSYSNYHRSGGSLKYSGAKYSRPFPIPRGMHADRERQALAPFFFDTVFQGDFRYLSSEVEKIVLAIVAVTDRGGRVGLVEKHAPGVEAAARGNGLAQEIRDLVDGDRVVVLVYGDEVLAGEVIDLAPSLSGGRYQPIVRLLSTSGDK